MSLESLAYGQQATNRVSVDSSGGQANDLSWTAALSADGRFVAFESQASNLIVSDTNGVEDVFLRDGASGLVERVSVDSSGIQGNRMSLRAAISADGDVVAFCSRATNLVPGDTNGTWDVFVHDRSTGVTERVNVDSSGVEANGPTLASIIGLSSDGGIVVFDSDATNLVPNDTNGAHDVFVHDRSTGLTERVSVDSSGVQGDSYSSRPSISTDGRFVSFDSAATNLISNDSNGYPDVFVHDRSLGITERVSVDSSGAEGNFDSSEASISADGRFVAFQSEAWNLVPSNTNNVSDAFIHDRSIGTTTRVSVDSSGQEGNGLSTGALISADGNRVAFNSFATNLVPGDTNKWYDGFVHDDATGITALVTVDSSGNQGNNGSVPQSISGDGRYVVFASYASNLVPNDTNGVSDDFIHGPYLTLEADPQAAPAGTAMTFTTWTGATNGLCLLVANDINGTPTFLPAVLGSFDASGVWTLSGIVPSGLSGNVVTFETYGFIATGKVDVSNAFPVSFQ